MPCTRAPRKAYEFYHFQPIGQRDEAHLLDLRLAAARVVLPRIATPAVSLERLWVGLIKSK